jgi:hypothetical protein
VANVRVIINPVGIRATANDPRVRAGLDRLAADCVNDMKRKCPVSPVFPVYATGGATVPGGRRYAGDFPLRPSGYLRSSIGKWPGGPGEFIIGASADYAPYVNHDTVRHIIRSHGPWPLRNRATGQVFGPVVHHPGTRGSYFVERTAAALDGKRIRI